MRDKFKMTVTINRFTSPRLHEVLSECPTDRERAAALRGLAESALAGQAPALRLASAFPLTPAPSPQRPGLEAATQIDVIAIDHEHVDAGGLDDAIMGDLGQYLA